MTRCSAPIDASVVFASGPVSGRVPHVLYAPVAGKPARSPPAARTPGTASTLVANSFVEACRAPTES